ncbi:MAG: M48 family metallopeptidase, partial [Zoogloea sp.]|nr:M48 family metallopeptidase [Zoogloea sp.]
MSDSEHAVRVAASLFDGRTSRPIPVWLSLAGGILSARSAESDAELCSAPAAEVTVDEPLGNAPRRIGFSQGAFCELSAGAELDELLAALGHRESRLSRWQRSTRHAVLALVAVAAMLGAGYVWGLPAFAGWLAQHVPAGVEARIGSSLLTTLDAGKILSPSRLPEARRQAVVAAVEGLTQRAGLRLGYHLDFRDAPQIGPNAFALPGGEVVVTDQLVKMAPTPDHVAAVLA